MGRVSNRAVSSLFYAVVGALFILPIGHVNAATKMGGTYVGSETCATCHRPQHNEWVLSGHSQMLRKSEDARKMGLPLPEGWAWDDISYVIGGRNWKLRFVDKKGYIVTMTGPKKDKPGKNQFNVENRTWNDYHPGERKKQFSCARCHTTGYSKEGHQDGLPGIVGTWAEPVVGCESCHRPGGDHVAQGGKKELITINNDKTMCGQCHIIALVDEGFSDDTQRCPPYPVEISCDPPSGDGVLLCIPSAFLSGR